MKIISEQIENIEKSTPQAEQKIIFVEQRKSKTPIRNIHLK